MAVLGKAPVSGGQLPTISFMTSQTWTPAYDLTAYVYVIGAGGSGGATNNSAGGACGGGAGGCAVSKLDLSASTTYTVTIGVGGDRKYADSTNATGNAGGNTSFSGSDISTMTGNGGAGGVTRSSNDATYVSGAAGGTATGGNLGNFTGGKGAEISSGVTGTSAYIMGGGGAVGLWSTGQDAPDAISAYGYTTRGGMLNIEKNDLNPGKWYNRASNQSAGDHHENGYPTIEAFQGITTQLITVTAPNTSATDYDRNHTIRTGTINSKGSAHINSSTVWGIQSAPFEGGSGQGVAIGYGARGCAGSGGGGSYAYSAPTQSGGGGMGLVLIFPISIGA